jgi:hypothetical protein
MHIDGTLLEFCFDIYSSSCSIFEVDEIVSKNFYKMTSDYETTNTNAPATEEKSPAILSSPMKAAAAAAFSAALAAHAPSASGEHKDDLVTSDAAARAAEGANLSSSTNKGKTKEETDEAVADLVAEGKKALALNEFETAVQKLGQASSIL